MKAAEPPGHRLSGAKESQGDPEPLEEELACPICSTPASSFESFNQEGGLPRRCPSCGSLERQRALVEAHDEFVGDGYSFTGKRILQISTSGPERTFLDSKRPLEVVTLDIRPELKPDIVADLCAMPQVPTETYDVVIASCVMQHVHNVHAALAEIHRVLKLDGIYVSCEALGTRTRTFSDSNEITQWYGTKAFEKYNVGTFRSLGAQDFLRDLQSYFLAKTYHVCDGATEKKQIVQVCIKGAD